MENATETSEIFEYNGIVVSQSEDLPELWEEIAEEINQSDNPSEEMNLAEEFLTALVAVEEEEGFVSSKDAWKTRVSEVTGSNKSSINDLYDHVYSNHLSGSGDDSMDKTPLNEFLETRVDQLYVIKSTDSNVDAKYQWHFEGGTTIETQREWKQPHLMRDVIYDELGVNLNEPSVDKYEDWVKTWMLEIREVEETRGSRTLAAEDLQSQVASYTAYTDRQRAAREEQCYVESTDDYNVVEIPNTVVTRICDEHNLGNSATLHAEMKAMGALARSSKQTKHPDGTRSTWWCLNADWAEPREVSNSNESPVDDAQDDPLVGGEA